MINFGINPFQFDLVGYQQQQLETSDKNFKRFSVAITKNLPDEEEKPRPFSFLVHYKMKEKSSSDLDALYTGSTPSLFFFDHPQELDPLDRGFIR